MKKAKTKLPKWVIFILPFGEECSTLSVLITPLVILSLCLIGSIWKDFYEKEWLWLEFPVTLIVIVKILKAHAWFIIQGDILKALREELMTRYTLTDNPKEKLRYELAKLCLKPKDG